MEKQALIGLSKISLLLVMVMVNLPDCFSQRSFGFYGGAGINQTIPVRANAGDLKNYGEGKLSSVFDVLGKFRFNNHLSLSVQYMALQNRFGVAFDDIIVSNSRQSLTGGPIGNISFRDEVYLYGNAGGVYFNYEKPFHKNNLTIGLGVMRVYYNSNRNYIVRNYDALPSTTKFSTIDQHQRSDLSGAKLTSLCLALSYERLLYKNKLGVFAKLAYIYNVSGNTFQYRHSGLGLYDNYSYAYKDRAVSTMRYYTLSFQTLSLTAGIFVNINFKSNEKTTNN